MYTRTVGNELFELDNDVGHTTAIFHWTYRAELTNDPGFRVNQK